MIKKPPEGFGRESAAVAAVRTVAANGKTAVATGGRMLRGGLICAFGGLWAFAGLAAGAGGSLPTLIGAGALGLLAIAVGLKIMRGPRTATAPGDVGMGDWAAAPSVASAGATTTLYFDRNKLLAHAGFGVLVTLCAVWGVGHFGGAMRFVVTLLIPVFALMTVGSARRAFGGDLTALRWDRQALHIRTLFKDRDLAWSEVADVGVQQVNTYAVYGLIKVGQQRSLMLRLNRGGLFGGKVGVSASLLDLEGRTLETLVLELQAAKAGLGASHAPMASATRPSAPPQARAPGPAKPRPVPTVQQPGAFGTAAAPTFGRRRA